MGSSRMSTFGSSSRISSSCSRRFWPPERSFTGVESCALVKPEALEQLPGRELDGLQPSPTVRGALLGDHGADALVARFVELGELLAEGGDLHGLAALHRPVVGCTVPATRPSSVDLPAPLTPRMPVRSPGAMRHSSRAARSSCRAPVAASATGYTTDTSSRSTTSLPRRGDREPAERDRVAHRRLVLDELVRGIDAELRLRRARGRAAAQPGELLAHEVLPLRLGSPRPSGRARRAAACRPRTRPRTARRCRRAPPRWRCRPRRGTSGRG